MPCCICTSEQTMMFELKTSPTHSLLRTLTIGVTVRACYGGCGRGGGVVLSRLGGTIFLKLEFHVRA